MTCIVRTVYFVTVFFFAGLLSCSDPTPELVQKMTRCQQLSARGAIDDQCAIEIAKREIVAREKKLDYSRFKVRFDDPDKVWVVEAIHEPEMPGRFRVVSIDKSGKVTDYMLGF
jgi:hypothetical protein